MNPNIGSFPMMNEPFDKVCQLLKESDEGFIYHFDNPQENIDDCRYIKYKHIENECEPMNPQQIEQFAASLAEPPAYYPRLVGLPVPQEESKDIYCRSVVLNCAGTTQLLLCQKCQKVNRNFESWTCPHCHKHFHFECLPKHMRVYYADEQDPYFTIPITDILHGKQTVEPCSLEEVHNYYENDGHYRIENEVYINGAVYCPDCFERSCHVCRGLNATLTCKNCLTRFHKDCVENYVEGQPYVCEMCQIDCGYLSVDKILAIKLLSFEDLHNLAVTQLKEKMNYDNNKTFEQNYANYSSNQSIRLPNNVYLADRFYFLVKLNYESYWRVKWISHQRIQFIARHRLSAVNLLNCLSVYFGMKREFGFSRVVLMNEINPKLEQTQSDEILKYDFSESSDSDASTIVTQTETEIPESTQAEEVIVSNCELPKNFEYLEKVEQDQFVMDSVPEPYKGQIQQILGLSPEFLQDAVVNYAMILHENGVPPAFLIPNGIASRHGQAYLVRWLGGNYESSTFETIYFLMPYGRTELIHFLLESMDAKRNSLFMLIGLEQSKKSWISEDKSKWVEGRLNVYKPLVTAPPYILLGQKNLYDFQLVGINWLLFTHAVKRGVLFCDEMGLGKTIQICTFIAALTEQGCFGPHIVVCPTSTLNNWMRELKRWLPFLSVALLEVTDTIGIDISLKSNIKAAMHCAYEKQSEKDSEAVNISIEATNCENDATCRETRKLLLENIERVAEGYQEGFNGSSLMLSFSPHAAREYCGARHYDIILLSYETATNLYRKKIDTIQYRDSDQKVYNKSYSNHFSALLESMGPFTTVICDEGHRLKGGLKNQVYAVLDHIEAKQRIILTGTPIQNNFEEFTNLLSFIEPAKFDAAHCEKLIMCATNASSTLLTQSERREALQTLNEMVRPHILIRSHEDVFEDPVEKAEIYVPVDMTRKQKLIYSKIIFDDRFNLTQKRLFKQRASLLRNTAVSLRHVCNHPVLLDRKYQAIIQKMNIEEFLDMSAKMKMVDRLLKGIHERGRKVLIFSQFVMILNTLEILLKKRDYKFLRLDGSVHSADRQQLIDKFNNPTLGYTVFILSTNSGGMGINLQSAQDVIIFDASWNPENDLQAQFRAARIGQTHIVRVYKIFCRDSIDERILERAKQKLNLSYILVKPLSGESKIADEDAMDDILSYGCENLLKDFKAMSADMLQLGELMQGGLDFESPEFQEFMSKIEDREIEYTDKEIDRLLDMEPQILAEEEAKCLHNSAESDDDNGGKLNKNEFFAAFRVAEFKVEEKEVRDESFATQARDKRKVSQMQKATGIVADKTQYWTQLFSETFGEEVLISAKDVEDPDNAEIDAELLEFKPASTKNQKLRDAYEFEENCVPVVKFAIDSAKPPLALEARFVKDTVNQLVDISSKAEITYDMPEAHMKQLKVVSHSQLSNLPAFLQNSCWDILKFAFASPCFPCAMLNHRELYRLQYEHKEELKISAKLMDELLKQPEQFVFDELEQQEANTPQNLLQFDAHLWQQIKSLPDYEKVVKNIQENLANNRCYVYDGVFRFERADRTSQCIISVNDHAFCDTAVPKVMNITDFEQQMAEQTNYGISGQDYYEAELPSLIAPGKFAVKVVNTLRKLTAYYYKLILTLIDNNIHTIAEIDAAFNIVYFRRVCCEIIRKFESSGNDFNQAKQLTGVDIEKTTKRFTEKPIIETEALPTTSGKFDNENLQEEFNRLIMILYKEDLGKSRLYVPYDYDKVLREELISQTSEALAPTLEEICKEITAIVLICSLLGLLTQHNIELYLQAEKYVHILNYNDELDSEYDLLQKNWEKPKATICSGYFKFNFSNDICKEILKNIEKYAQIELYLEAEKNPQLDIYSEDEIISSLQQEEFEINEEIEALKKESKQRQLAEHTFVDYIKYAVIETYDELNVMQESVELTINPKGQKEGFWHPLDSYAFGFNYQQRRELFIFFIRCGLPIDPDTFMLYKSPLGQVGKIRQIIDFCSNNDFEESFVEINKFFRDRIIALFELKKQELTNPDALSQECELYSEMICKGEPIVWKNLPFDPFIAEFGKEHLFMILFNCTIMDGCKEYLKTLLYYNNGEKAVLEALIELPIIQEEDKEEFGLGEGEPLPMFTRNRVISNENRRQHIQNEFKTLINENIEKIQDYLPKEVLIFCQKCLENDWIALICGLIIMGLFRYGLTNYTEYILEDQSINLTQVLKNARVSLKSKNDRFERSSVFSISDPAKLIATVQLTDIEKCEFLAAILSSVLLATEFTKGGDYSKSYWSLDIQQGSPQVWHAMESISKNFTAAYNECEEIRKEVDPLVNWFSDYKFALIVEECYPKEK